MTAGSSDEGPAEAVHDRTIRVGISACLLGQKVRYDGRHKHAGFLFDAFGPAVEWIAVCPEVEAGFGTPREPVQLTRCEAGAIRLVTVTTERDLTAPMDEFIRRRLPELSVETLSGYVLKANSPSCGPGQVKIFDRHGVAAESGRGLFADALIRHFPDLPVEDEGRLAGPRALDDFIERVFAYHADLTRSAPRRR
jgi:uncharacterized protein YbbK (DUF523 family)